MPQLEQLAALAELYKAGQIHSHAFSAHRVSHDGVFTIRNAARVFLCVAEALHELLNFLGRAARLPDRCVTASPSQILNKKKVSFGIPESVKLCVNSCDRLGL
jgi:hypothetical protein